MQNDLCYKAGGLTRVVEYFELHASRFRVNPQDWVPLLHASLDVLIRSGNIINAREVTGGFPARFSLEKE
jgi:hypothetical protein